MSGGRGRVRKNDCDDFGLNGAITPKDVAHAPRSELGSSFRAQEKMVKHTFRILALLTLPVLFAIELSGCGDGNSSAAGTAAATPVSEVDALINDYEKTGSNYVRLGKKMKGGDVSVTILFMEAEKELKEQETKLQTLSPKLSSGQAKRVAAVKAKLASAKT